MSTNYRNRVLYVSSSVHEGLAVLAEVLGHSCADETADIELGKILETHHKLDWLRARSKRDREARLAEYRELLKQ